MIVILSQHSVCYTSDHTETTPALFVRHIYRRKNVSQFSGSGSCDYRQQTIASGTMPIPHSYIISGWL